ncbi:MAG: PD-(D/E)XK nuclease family protein [archaeon]|nr:PD-(D/E)XK nuclease family protein [archaeon]
MPTYSYSKISSFEQCPLKFKYKYIDKVEIKEKNIELFLGNMVHETLEWLYLKVREGQTPTIEETIKYYCDNWENKFDDSLIITKQQYNFEYYFNLGVKFIIDYYIKHQPFDDNTIALEKKILIDLDELKNYQLIGFIDRLVYNKEKDEYEIHDYKTANSLPLKEKIESDRQLALYSIAIKNEFNAKKVHLFWHYLAFNKTIYTIKTDEELIKLKKDVLELIKKIESTQEYAPNQSVLCNWCEFKNICEKR